ncbi:hypothetical protein [Ruminococcus flavefaciens]|uniref:hypothetical protein n=1 Tax=Ruminococcus flavefaciens TaxID=1265 RepID=UPI0026EEF98E|nr:hypothetical protein [Ruminococcus flavefaciens]
MTYLNTNADMQIRDSLAASTTDLIQSIIMTVALISIVIFGINAAGGMGNVIDNENSLEGHFSLCHIHNTETLGATFGLVMMRNGLKKSAAHGQQWKNFMSREKSEP